MSYLKINIGLDYFYVRLKTQAEACGYHAEKCNKSGIYPDFDYQGWRVEVE